MLQQLLNWKIYFLLKEGGLSYMIRTGVWFLFFWIYLLGTLPKLVLVNKRKDAGEIADQIARKWSGHLLRLAGADVEVVGEANVPLDQSVVFVSNHQSNFDIPLMIAKVPGTKGFVAKVETLKIPIVRTWMRHMKCVFIDRSDIRQQVRTIIEGVQNIKSGQSMVVFPEGTRSPDGSLGEFKAGSLKLAIKSGASVVPVAIINSRGLMPKGAWKIKPAKVKMIIGTPIEISETHVKETVALSNLVKERIQEAFEKYETIN